MKTIESIKQCRKDIEGLKSAVKSVREHAIDLIIDEMRYRKTMEVPAGKLTVIVGAFEDSPFEGKNLAVSGIALGAGKDTVDLTGRMEDAGNDVTVSVYDVENPESILGYLEETAA